ncbi:MAG: 6-oxocyclohex-1-ene-1-carbonyl-CoA hydratase [Planctomycetes bacterium]|nr:6-oxocyclohex-1-ene-1-carbonyl-CoA hydratase [Planctomycetota bacterium]MCW8135992.1 6-oxocyclohex-1-ene-1-carbonyl-CoA hydratase [Planctomycetota bacterium]
MNLVNHELLPDYTFRHIRYERRTLRDPKGREMDGLYNAWIWLNNERQFNSYTTDAIKEIILAFRRASMDRAVVAAVFTAVGDKAFCTGGNTKEYAEYYAGNPQEYRQYMRLFNDMVSAILMCDKPVINRVNGMRIGGGQEIGMACDFHVVADTARFGQAGPKHGSAPDGGATDFLPLFVGMAHAMESCVLCEPMSAHKALRLGLINKIVPVLRHGERFIANPLVVTDCYSDEFGNIVFGESKSGDALAAGKALLKECTTDHRLLDAAVDEYCWKLSQTMPDCTTKTTESLRKFKLEHWDRNRETNRAWLALNMMTEANAGFRAFNEGPKDRREVDFIALRRELAKGRPWSEELIREVSPQFDGEKVGQA